MEQGPCADLGAAERGAWPSVPPRGGADSGDRRAASRRRDAYHDPVDLNADLGESYGAWRAGDDAALLDVVTSANVACGFHAGDPSVLLATCRAAAERGVVVGAHVGYADLANFGRVFVDVPDDRLYADVLYQLGALAGACAVAGARLAYVKPHGALYHAAATHPGQASAVVRAVAEFSRTRPEPLALVGLPGGLSLRLAADAGLRGVGEAFADRGYAADGTLVPRGEPGALLHDPAAIAERVVGFARTGTIAAVDGEPVRVSAETVCVHGDSPDAVAIARAARLALEASGVAVRPFA